MAKKEEKEKTLAEVKEKCESGEYKIVDVSHLPQYSSKLWKKFHRIFDNKKKPQNYVFCTDCKVYLPYVGVQGNNGMRRHSCGKSKPDEDCVEIDTHFAVVGANLKESKKKFTMACVKFVAMDIKAYNVVAGEGFEQLIQCAINIGASRKRVNASDIIPHRKTVANKTRKLALAVREKVRRYFSFSFS